MNELFRGLGWIIVYTLVCLPVLLFLRVKTKFPNELFRKLLHLVLLGILQVWVLVFDTWWIAAAACLGLVLICYPILWLFERVKGYSSFVNERKLGEFRASLVDVFLMFAVVLCVCWGWLGDKFLVMGSVYAWGFGDAVAALTGKRFGRHRICCLGVAGKKSCEGTAAMFLTSFLSVAVILTLRGGLHWLGYLLISLVTASVSALLELVTPNGHDTVACPLGAMVTLIALLFVFGGL